MLFRTVRHNYGQKCHTQSGAVAATFPSLSARSRSQISETKEIFLPRRHTQLAQLCGARALESMHFVFSTLFKGLKLTEFRSCHLCREVMAHGWLALFPILLGPTLSPLVFLMLFQRYQLCATSWLMELSSPEVFTYRKWANVNTGLISCACLLWNLNPRPALGRLNTQTHAGPRRLARPL